MKTHYDTLGVATDASLNDIKAAYRARVKECHPDVVAGHHTKQDAAHEFKRVSHAHSILSNEKERVRYDRSLEASRHHRWTTSSSVNPADFAHQHRGRRRGRFSGYAPTAGLPLFWHTLLRPRTLLLTTAVLFSTTTLYSFYQRRQASHQDMVQAWLNPRTHRYETPAPWDPLYKTTQPKLQSVPRHQVVQSHR